jgi:6-pyruvoyl-tetrahydropterin synthase
MYPHGENFMSTISEYIDYSDNEELWKEVTELSSIEQIRYEGMLEEITEEVTERVTEEVTERVTEEVTERVTEEVTEKVREEGIQAVILDNLEEQIPKERILMKLQKHFNLTEEKSKKYYEKFASARLLH